MPITQKPTTPTTACSVGIACIHCLLSELFDSIRDQKRQLFFGQIFEPPEAGFMFLDPLAQLDGCLLQDGPLPVDPSVVNLELFDGFPTLFIGAKDLETPCYQACGAARGSHQVLILSPGCADLVEGLQAFPECREALLLGTDEVVGDQPAESFEVFLNCYLKGSF